MAQPPHKDGSYILVLRLKRRRIPETMVYMWYFGLLLDLINKGGARTQRRGQNGGGGGRPCEQQHPKFLSLKKQPTPIDD